jgi:hypothetical protein
VGLLRGLLLSNRKLEAANPQVGCRQRQATEGCRQKQPASSAQRPELI